jgi:hypothetical protein
MPAVMTLAAVFGIRAMRQQERREEGRNAWRDDSLDDWRHERDAANETAREARARAREERLAAGGEAEEAEPIRTQRIGG